MDDVTSVLDALGSSRTALFGVAEGGPLCAIFAATYPARTSALILYASFARGAWAPDYPWAWTAQQLEEDIARNEQALQGGMEDQDFRDSIEQLVPSLVDDPESQPWLRKAFAISGTPGAMIALMRMEFEVDIRAILPTVRIPTLVINRTGDRVADLEEGRWLATQIPGARFVELPGIDHPPWAGNQDAVIDAMGAFLGLRRQPAELDRVLSTVLFTDIVGSTQLVTKLGDTTWRSILAEHHERGREEIVRHHGHHVDSTGDGLFATFDGPARAIWCAQAIGESVRNLGIQIRAGVHTGEVEREGDFVRGITVHIGARICAMAAPAQVLVSQTVKGLVAGSGLTFEDAGEHELKGVPDPWRLYQVVV